MKNRIFLFCLLAALAVSCIKDQQEVIQSMSDNPVFYASIEETGDQGTRVFVDDQLRVLWNADDRVSIFNKTTYNRQYRFDGEDGANSGTFKKVQSDDFVTSNPLNYVYSVYPYNENTSISNDGEMTVYLPAEQTYRANSFGLGANTMIAITDEDELMFKNLCGYFAIKLYGDNVAVSSITLKGNNNELLADKATVVAQMDAAPTIQFDAENATKELTLTCTTPVTLGTTAETATTFWFVIPPTTFENGITLTVNDYNNGSFEKSASTSLEIKRNTLKKSAALKVIYESSQPKNVIYYTSSDGKIVTPNNISAFGATLLSNEYIDGRGVMSFGDDVTGIGNNAFKNCSLLTSVTIPQSVKYISEYAFFRCSGLTSIEIPDAVTLVGSYAFYGCDGLTEVRIPRNVTTIGSTPFSNCPNITSLSVDPNNKAYDSRNDCNGIINKQYDRLIAGCKNTVIPSDVTSIAAGAFEGCSGLISILIPESVTAINKNAFASCTGLTSVTIPENVLSLGDGVFYGCTNLSSVSLSKNLTEIAASTFSECSKLTDIIIPNLATIIGHNAFYKCSSLTSIAIPARVTRIEYNAFAYCSSITSIVIMRETPPEGNSMMFYDTNNAPIYVPASSVEAYKTAEYWSEYSGRIQPID